MFTNLPRAKGSTLPELLKKGISLTDPVNHRVHLAGVRGYAVLGKQFKKKMKDKLGFV